MSQLTNERLLHIPILLLLEYEGEKDMAEELQRKEKVCGIYCIENLINGKKYVGQSMDIYTRWRDHINCWKRQDARYEKNPHLIYSFMLYGLDNFSFYILEMCEPDIDILNKLEIEYIAKYQSNSPEFGYNLTSGGGGVSGYKHNEERRKKISENTPRMRGENHPCFGKHWDDEAKLNLHNKNSRENCAVFGTKHPDSASQYHGVGIYNQKMVIKGIEYKYTYWKVRLRVDKKDIHVGYFKTEEEAARAYDKYIVDHGLKNPLNFPKDYIDMT